MSVKLLQLLKAMYYYDCIISKRKINPWLSFTVDVLEKNNVISVVNL